MIPEERRGHFIVFEGLDGAGKSTQARLLVRQLNFKGEESVLVNPSSRIHALYQSLSHSEKTFPPDLSYVLLMLTSRVYQAQTKVAENLRTGKSVVADRYIQTPLVEAMLRKINLGWQNEILMGLPRPDLIIYVAVSPETAMRRKKSPTVAERGGLMFPRLSKHDAFVSYESLAMKAYESLCSSNQDWIKIDGDLSIKEMQQEILGVVERRLGLVERTSPRTIRNAE